MNKFICCWRWEDSTSIKMLNQKQLLGNSCPALLLLQDGDEGRNICELDNGVAITIRFGLENT